MINYDSISNAHDENPFDDIWRVYKNKYVVLERDEKPSPDWVLEWIGISGKPQPEQKQIGGSHYANDNDVFKFSLDNGHDCLQHAAIKYIHRHHEKNGKEDILKAMSVLNRILKEQYE